MTRFSKSLLENIAKLDEETLKERVGNYLMGFQIRAILKRRDLILTPGNWSAREARNGFCFLQCD